MKGQITVFIIVGLVLILSVGGLLFLRSSLQEINSEDAGKNLFIQDQSLEAYVRTCTQQETEQVLNDLFLSGGKLSQEDGGQFPNTDQYTYGILKIPSSTALVVSEGYQPPSASAFEGLMTINAYGSPTGIFNYPRDWTEYMTNYYFGKVVLPKLCNSVGPNGFAATKSAFTCLPQLYDQSSATSTASETIQNQISDALTSKIYSCFENLPHGYEISVKNPGKVIVTFTDDEILVDLNRTVIDLNNNLEIKNLSYVFPYRVKRLYSAAYLTALFDVNSITFDKSRDLASLPTCTFAEKNSCFDSQMIVSVIRNYTVKDDLVIIQDRASKFYYAKNNYSVMTFAFVVENRRPYLEYIPKQPTSNVAPVTTGRYCNYPPKTSMRFNILVYDPDEDEAGIYAGTEGGISSTRLFPGPMYTPLYDSPTPVPSYKLNLEPTPIVDMFRTITIPSGAPKQVAECLAGYYHCVNYHDSATNQDFYLPTTFPMKIIVDDGQYSDYQEFLIEACT